MNPIKLIATDLDGTLLGSGGVLLAENTRALKRAQDAGIAVAICSGRLPAICSRIAREMGLDACKIIGLNGTQIWDAPFGRELFCAVFPEETARACWKILKDANVPVTHYGPDSVFTNQRFDTESAETRYRNIFGGAGVTVEIAPDAVERGIEGKTLKLLAKFPGGKAQEDAVCAALRSVPGILLTTARAGTMEIMLAACGKAAGLSRVADALGITAAEVMAFGDFDNDLEMLRWAGFGVAMENGTAEVKRAARHITGLNTQAGVAQAVHAYLDGGFDA